MELCDKSAVELSRLLKSKEISSKELVESVFKRIDKKEGSVNAYITQTKEIALKQAEKADKRIAGGEETSQLNGIPIAIKDNLCTKGIRTTCASKILENYITHSFILIFFKVVST